MLFNVTFVYMHPDACFKNRMKFRHERKQFTAPIQYIYINRLYISVYKNMFILIHNCTFKI
jgi:hypothetical protein